MSGGATSTTQSKAPEQESQYRIDHRLMLEFGDRKDFDDPKLEWRRLFSELLGTFFLVPRLRRWLATAVRPRLQEVVGHLLELGREPKRLAIIVGGCAATTLGNAFALWAAIEAFDGNTSFITVTVVTMVGGTLASAAPTPGGVGAVEAALIGGLAAFGMAAAVAVPSVLLYRVLTTWLPVFIGWQVMRWMTKTEKI